MMYILDVYIECIYWMYILDVYIGCRWDVYIGCRWDVYKICMYLCRGVYDVNQMMEICLMHKYNGFNIIYL